MRRGKPSSKERAKRVCDSTGAGADQGIIGAQKPCGSGNGHRNKIINSRHEFFLNRIGNFIVANYKVSRQIYETRRSARASARPWRFSLIPEQARRADDA
jgi:hypothetical protein